MSQVTFAWHFAKGIASPVIGATKAKYLDDAVGALDLRLSAEDIAAIDENYIPHRIVGAVWRKGIERTGRARRAPFHLLRAHAGCLSLSARPACRDQVHRPFFVQKAEVRQFAPAACAGGLCVLYS